MPPITAGSNLTGVSKTKTTTNNKRISKPASGILDTVVFPVLRYRILNADKRLGIANSLITDAERTVNIAKEEYLKTGEEWLKQSEALKKSIRKLRKRAKRDQEEKTRLQHEVNWKNSRVKVWQSSTSFWATRVEELEAELKEERESKEQGNAVYKVLKIKLKKEQEKNAALAKTMEAVRKSVADHDAVQDARAEDVVQVKDEEE